MGARISRIGSDPSRSRVNRRQHQTTRARLSSLLICGCSSSRNFRKVEEEHARVGVSSSKDCSPINNIVQKPAEEAFVETRKEMESSSTNAETGTSSESSTQTSECTLVPNGSSSGETNKQGKCLSKTESLLVPCQVNIDLGDGDSCRNRSSTVASTSFREDQSSSSVNVVISEDATNDLVNSVNEPISHLCLGPIGSSSQEFTLSSSNGVSDDRHLHEFRVRDTDDISTDSFTSVSGLEETLDLLGDAAMPSNLEFLVSNGERDEGDESTVHVDVASTSSNILSGTTNGASNLEVRRNRRRLFLDAISRRSSGRLIEYPNIGPNGDNDDRGSDDRQLSFSNGSFPGDEHRMHRPNGRRQRSGSELWARLLSGINDNERQRDAFCPFGVHPDGSCSCESFLTNDESSIHASISRIVMLAEALFEVLDEINHRPGSFSLPLMSLPAPESVVNSFPVKKHKKVEPAEAGDDIQQCYICLSEYEDGDKIRVLPCHHEYHMACVDKWLKEIHGVCPLCRGDVTQGVTESSSSDAPCVS